MRVKNEFRNNVDDDPIQCRSFTCARLPELEKTGEWCLQAGHWQTRQHHLHSRCLDELVLLYCVAGCGVFTLAGTVRPVHAGTLFFCPAGIVHGYTADRVEGWELWWVHFNGWRANELCAQAGLSLDTPVLVLGDRPNLIWRFANLLYAMRGEEHLMPWEAAGCLHALLLELIRGRHLAENDSSLVRFIHDDDTSLDDMVKRSGYSKYHFCRLFKKETGLSPWRYLQERKLARARELLLNTHESVKAIAGQLDFANPDYFAKCFRRYTGVTPEKYRGAH